MGGASGFGVQPFSAGVQFSSTVSMQSQLSMLDYERAVLQVKGMRFPGFGV